MVVTFMALGDAAPAATLTAAITVGGALKGGLTGPATTPFPRVIVTMPLVTDAVSALAGLAPVATLAVMVGGFGPPLVTAAKACAC